MWIVCRPSVCCVLMLLFADLYVVCDVIVCRPSVSSVDVIVCRPYVCCVLMLLFADLLYVVC